MTRVEAEAEPEPSGRTLLTHAATLSLVSFAVHFAWENVQCRLFIHLATEPTQWAMLQASAGDVVLTWVAQGVVAIAVGDWLEGRDDPPPLMRVETTLHR